jgi:serine/threonine protein kinase
MSPEQAKGRPTDKRSDVWSFGAVVHEMVSGQRTFQGADIADRLAALLRQDVEWTALPAATPAPVGYLLARCFELPPTKRFSNSPPEARRGYDRTPSGQFVGLSPSDTRTPL